MQDMEKSSSISTKESIAQYNNEIKLLDSDPDNNLSLYSYIKCTDDSKDIVKNSRGLIFHDNKLLVKSLGYTADYIPNDIRQNSDLIGDITKCNIYESEEGCLLRVFNFNNKWYICTHRKLNAFKSKWSSKESFGEIFRNAVNYIKPYDEFLNTLNKDYKYLFLVRNNYENRIVCQAPEKATIFHVGTYDSENNFIITEDVGVSYPKKCSFQNIEDMLAFIENEGFNRIQGVIVFSPNKVFKILNKEYLEFFKIRGNEPSIKYRYLQVRMDSEKSNKLYFLYPKFGDIFDEYEDLIYKAAQQINFYYIRRFIKKKYVTVPKEEYEVMKACHEWHKTDREKNRISIRKVISVLNDQSATSLNKIIKRVKNAQNQNADYNYTQGRERFLRPRAHTSPKLRSIPSKESISQLSI
ncbi:hypothetical protein OAK19_02415 [Aureispira]|nr:hypothetical protein [Aureispira sp.]